MNAGTHEWLRERASRKSRRWSAEEVARLARSLADGLSFVEIGRQIGRNPDAVRSKAIDAKLWTPKQRRSSSESGPSRYVRLYGD